MSYFYGGGPAKIKAEQLPAVFQRDIKIGLTVAECNNVFNTYYRAYHSMDDAVTHAARTPRYTPLSNLMYAMRDDLMDAAKQASMFNVRVPYFGARVGSMGQSLKSIFDELESKGKLKDDEWDGNGTIKAPAGIFAFESQMMARGSDIAKTFTEFKRWQKGMETWKQQQSWESLGSNLDHGQKVIELVGPKMWASFGFTSQRAGDLNAVAVKWWSLGAAIKGFMDSYIAVKSAPNQQRQLVAEVAAFVVGKVPVFGELYAGVIQALPKAMSYFEDYARRNDRAINGYFGH